MRERVDGTDRSALIACLCRAGGSRCCPPITPMPMFRTAAETSGATHISAPWRSRVMTVSVDNLLSRCDASRCRIVCSGESRQSDAAPGSRRADLLPPAGWVCPGDVHAVGRRGLWRSSMTNRQSARIRSDGTGAIHSASLRTLSRRPMRWRAKARRLGRRSRRTSLADVRGKC